MEPIDLAAANRVGVAIPGAEVLAETGKYKNPCAADASGFEFVIRLLACGVVVVSAVLKTDFAFGMTARFSLASTDLSYAEILKAFVGKKGLGAKVRIVGDYPVLVIGRYAEKKFSRVLFTASMERTNAAETSLILGMVSLLRTNAILHRMAKDRVESALGLGGGGGGSAGSMAGLLAALRSR